MSTRTTVLICDNGETLASLYRHYDGYPAETGADLITTLQELATSGMIAGAAQYTRALMGKTYAQEAHETSPRTVFRIEAMPGNIEHYYRVNFFDTEEGEKISFYHAARAGWDIAIEEWILTGEYYTPETFCDLVNRERKQANQRIAYLIKTEPFYKDAKLYPMIEWENRKPNGKN